MTTGTKTVIDRSRIGKKGFPLHPELYGMQPPTKEVPVDGPNDPGTAPDLPPTETDYGRAIQAILDAKAGERGYDGIATAVSYRDDPNATYAAEGKALFDWRSSVWTYVYAQLAEVQSGARAQPSVADFVTEVGQSCPFEWPATD